MDFSLVGLGLGDFCYIGGALQGVSAGWGLYIFLLFLSINKQNLAEKQKGFLKRL